MNAKQSTCTFPPRLSRAHGSTTVHSIKILQRLAEVWMYRPPNTAIFLWFLVNASNKKWWKIHSQTKRNEISLRWATTFVAFAHLSNYQIKKIKIKLHIFAMGAAHYIYRTQMQHTIYYSMTLIFQFSRWRGEMICDAVLNVHWRPIKRNLKFRSVVCCYFIAF